MNNAFSKREGRGSKNETLGLFPRLNYGDKREAGFSKTMKTEATLFMAGGP